MVLVTDWFGGGILVHRRSTASISAAFFLTSAVVMIEEVYRLTRLITRLLLATIQLFRTVGYKVELVISTFF